MAYSELIKNFDNIRGYIKDFFIYGFKTRDEYDKKSARSYDNEKRRIQSYLGDLVSFGQSPAGKNVFISLDGRSVTHNPLYRAFKAKSFTDKDITLHFIVMDILARGGDYTHQELLNIIEADYLVCFKTPITFDESTLRKKIKEYETLGFVRSYKEGRAIKYALAYDEIELEQYKDAIRFFTEEDILGVVGSYLEDKYEQKEEPFLFKNHYIMNAYDTEVIHALLQAIHEKREVEIINYNRRKNKEQNWVIVPLKLYVSVQGGRNYLMCKNVHQNHLCCYRIDYIRKASLGKVTDNYENILKEFEEIQKYIWGVTFDDSRNLEHIEIDIHVEPEEDFIVRRLEREKRCGSVSKIDDTTYRFMADVYDTYEMVPWIRSYFGRIQRIVCDNKEVVKQLKEDMISLAAEYEVNE